MSSAILFSKSAGTSDAGQIMKLRGAMLHKEKPRCIILAKLHFVKFMFLLLFGVLSLMKADIVFSTCTAGTMPQGSYDQSGACLSTPIGQSIRTYDEYREVFNPLDCPFGSSVASCTVFYGCPNQAGTKHQQLASATISSVDLNLYVITGSYTERIMDQIYPNTIPTYSDCNALGPAAWIGATGQQHWSGLIDVIPDQVIEVLVELQ